MVRSDVSSCTSEMCRSFGGIQTNNGVARDCCGETISDEA